MFTTFGFNLIYDDVLIKLEVKNRIKQSLGKAYEEYSEWEKESFYVIYHESLKKNIVLTQTHCLLFWGSIYSTTPDEILQQYLRSGNVNFNSMRGKFGIVIYDSILKRVFLIRDQYGVEKVYTSISSAGLFFGSHISPILESGLISTEPNYSKLSNFLKYSIAYGDETFFKGINELPMGNCLINENGTNKTVNYYKISEVLEIKKNINEIDAKQQFKILLSSAVDEQIKQHKNVGIALSGGLDSSFISGITAMIEMTNPSNKHYHFFSLRFENTKFDEGQYIQSVINKFSEAVDKERISTYSIKPMANDFVDDFPEIIKHIEEPFHKIHPFMYWMLSEAISKTKVPIVLLGQGAEAIIGGQTSSDLYAAAADQLKHFKIKNYFDEVIAISKNNKTSKYESLKRSIFPFLNPLLNNLSSPRQKLRESFISNDFLGYQCARITPPKYFKEFLNQNIFGDMFAQPDEFRQFQKNIYTRYFNFNFPFLDKRLVEYCYSLPNEFKVSKGKTKIIMRGEPQLLPDIVDQRIDKMMCSRIEKDWFRGALIPFTKETIFSNSFQERGIFNTANIQSAFKRHIKGEVNLAKEISRWLTVEWWFRIFID